MSFSIFKKFSNIRIKIFPGSGICREKGLHYIYFTFCDWILKILITFGI